MDGIVAVLQSCAAFSIQWIEIKLNGPLCSAAAAVSHKHLKLSMNVDVFPPMNA